MRAPPQVTPLHLRQFWYRGTSLMRKRIILGPYSRLQPKALWGSWVVSVLPLARYPRREVL